MTSISTETDALEIDPDLEAGQAVGEYVVDSKLGQGGFGAVFRATHPLIGKVVAIKVLARRFSLDPEMVGRFQAEARAVNQIRHRYIIDIFSFGTLPDGRAYYVMEYLDGETLDARLDRAGRLELRDAVVILRGVGKALDAAHAQGIAHRDLKPENVFLAADPDGGDFPKLLDFGIAKLMRRDDQVKSKTRTGVPMGTPYYMSPEQCRGRDVDHRTDYYAFGVVAYKMLTGAFPLDGDDYMTILMKQIADEPPPASVYNSDLPPAVDDVLAWLMRKEPSERPPSLAVAIAALEEAAGISPKETSAIRVPPSPRSSHGISAQKTPVVTPSSARQMALLATTPSGAPAMETIPPVARKSKLPVVLGGVGLAVVAAVAIGYALTRSSAPAESEANAKSPAHVDTPAPPPDSTSGRSPKSEVQSPIPQLVTITIHGAPDGTEVHGPNGTLLGVSPNIQLARGDHDLVLTFEADGYKPASRTLMPSADQTVEVALEKKAAAQPPVATPKPPVTTPKPPVTVPKPPVTTPKPPSTQNTLEDPFRK